MVPEEHTREAAGHSGLMEGNGARESRGTGRPWHGRICTNGPGDATAGVQDGGRSKDTGCWLVVTTL